MDLAREQLIAFRVRRAEAEAVRTAAQLAGKSLSGYIRDVLLDSARRRLVRTGPERRSKSIG